MVDVQFLKGEGVSKTCTLCTLRKMVDNYIAHEQSKTTASQCSDTNTEIVVTVRDSVSLTS